MDKSNRVDRRVGSGGAHRSAGMASPHNTPIEITIKIDPAAVAGIAQPIARVAASAWRIAISKPAIRFYLIALAVAVVIVAGALAVNSAIAAHIVAKGMVALVVVGAILLKRRYSPLIPD